MDNKIAEKYIEMQSLHGKGDIAKRNVGVIRMMDEGSTLAQAARAFGVSDACARAGRLQAISEMKPLADGVLEVGTPLFRTTLLHTRGEMPPRARCLFIQYGEENVTVESFCLTPMRELLSIPNLGRTTINEIIAFLKSHGFEHIERATDWTYNITSLRQVQAMMSGLGYRIVDGDGREANLEGLVRA